MAYILFEYNGGASGSTRLILIESALHNVIICRLTLQQYYKLSAALCSSICR